MSYTRISDQITSVKFPLEKIVIIGAGPVALSFAIGLHKLGVKNIICVDHRAGKYNRSFNFHPAVFSEFSKFVGSEITPSHHLHIKDAERELFKEAITLGIKFIRKKFHTFSKKSNDTIVLLDPETKEEMELDCDALFDCTGTKRAVISEYIKLNPEQPGFKITPIEGAPFKYFFLARGKFADETEKETCKIAAFIAGESNPEDPSHHLYLSRLREFGWDNYSFPNLTFHGFDKDKIVVTVPACNDLKEEDRLKYLSLVIQKHSAVDSTSFKLLETKNKDKANTGFPKSEHAMTTPAFVKQDKYPLIGHFGDASINLPFMSARGTRRALKMMKDFFHCIKVENGAITDINFAAFSDLFYKNQDENVAIAHSVFEKYGKEIIPARKKFQAHYSTLFQKTIKDLKEISEEKSGLSPTAPHTRVIATIQTFREIADNKILFDDIELKNFNTCILDLAERCALFAKYKFQKDNFDSAEQFYKIAINLHSSFELANYANKIIPLYSNLIICLNKLDKYAELSKFSEIARTKVLPLVTDKELHGKFVVKIVHNEIIATTNHIIYLLKTKNTYQAQMLLRKAQTLKISIADNTYIEASAFKLLGTKINEAQRNIDALLESMKKQKETAAVKKMPKSKEIAKVASMGITF